MRAYFLLCFLFPVLLFSQDKINEDVLALFHEQDKVPCIISMTEQLELLGTTDGLTKDEKASFVFNALKAHANATQEGIRSQLTSMGLSYKSYVSSGSVFWSSLLSFH